MAKRKSPTRKRTSQRPSPRRLKARKSPKRAARRARPAPKSTRRKASVKARRRTRVRPRPSPKSPRPQVQAASRRPRLKARRVARPIAELAAKAQPHDPHPPTLTRERRRLPDSERVSGDPDGDARLLAEARSGHESVARSLRQHTEAGPELTAGDVDAKWEDAYAIGDEAPGGDNPTPDQNEVDAIGRALGAEYDDDEELMGGEEIGARDAHRWELDPDSRDPGGDPGDDED
jgi:hypothetical protein